MIQFPCRTQDDLIHAMSYMDPFGSAIAAARLLSDVTPVDPRGPRRARFSFAGRPPVSANHMVVTDHGICDVRSGNRIR